MDSKEAQTALRQIEESQQAVQIVGRREVGWFFIIWGLVWLVGFLMSHQGVPFPLWWLWFGLSGVGGGLSAVVGIRLGQKVQYSQTGPVLGWFYPTFLGFGLLWIFLAEPMGWEKTAVFLITILTFAIVINGILLKQPLLIWTGLLGTVIVVLIYSLILSQFGLLMGLIGGGGMLLTGLVMQVQG